MSNFSLSDSGRPLIFKRWLVRGRVQGVFFRQSTRQKARELALSGWVRNLSDGSVEVCAVGFVDLVEELFVWTGSGPPFARVDMVEVCHSEHLTEDSQPEGSYAVAEFVIRD